MLGHILQIAVDILMICMVGYALAKVTEEIKPTGSVTWSPHLQDIKNNHQ